MGLIQQLSVLFLLTFSMPASAASSGFGQVVMSSGGGRGGGGRVVSKKRRSYAVVLEAGRWESRVHVFCFGKKLDLLPFGDGYQLFAQTKPGLSAYANDSQLAANSLMLLLRIAENAIPVEVRPMTPVTLEATPGLGKLGIKTFDQVFETVREVLPLNSSLKFQADQATILDGPQEGTFLWITINYLLENLGKKYSDSAGVIDLGCDSLQMVYAISEKAAANAPKAPGREDPYVKELYLKGTNYYTYVHSYANYGLFAARAGILKSGEHAFNYCVLGGFNGTYEYNREIYNVSSSPSGSSFIKCTSNVLEALKVDEACNYSNCSFNGVWNGGGGDGQIHLYAASFFFDRAVQAGFVDPTVTSAKVRPADFMTAAKHACQMSITDANAAYPNVKKEDMPYLCMDLVYQYTLLVEGFGLELGRKIKVARQLQYDDFNIDVAWPLGSAIQVLSEPKPSTDSI